MARQRADLDHAVLDADAVEAADAVDVDQQRGLDSRMFKVAIRLCPPASSFASPGARRAGAIASSSERAFA